MAHKPKAQTILKWLRENGIRLGALTSHDTSALLAATQLAELWLRGDYGNRKLSEIAFRSTVLQMQESTQFMAFHAIAHCGDWIHRWELWRNAELPKEVLEHVPECKFGPRRAPSNPVAAPVPTCDCGAQGSWHGERDGYRAFCCDACWEDNRSRSQDPDVARA